MSGTRIVIRAVMLMIMCGGMPGCGGSTQNNSAPVAEIVSATVGETVLIKPTLTTNGLGAQADLQTTEVEIQQAKDLLAATNGFIMILTPTFDTDYHFTVAKAARQRAEDLGLAVETHSADTDPATATALINDAVSRGAKAIIIDVFNPAILPALQAAVEQGVHVVQYAGRTASDLGVNTISIEDADLGTVAGEYAGQLIIQELGGQADVVILDFPDAPQVVLRANAIRDALLATSPKATIVGNYKGGTTEFGLEAMTLALQEYPNVNVIVSINDAGAYGAYQALTAAGRTAEDTIIVGIDGEELAREYIAQGTMYRGTVDTAPDITGAMAMDAVIKLLAGSAFPQNIRVPVQLLNIETLSEQ